MLNHQPRLTFTLKLLEKEKDGYHELAMIMQNIDLSDYIEFENNDIGAIELSSNCKDLSLNR